MLGWKGVLEVKWHAHEGILYCQVYPISRLDRLVDWDTVDSNYDRMWKIEDQEQWIRAHIHKKN